MDSGLLQFKQDGVITVATVVTTNMLDSLTVSEFGDELVNYVQAHPKVKLLLDFENVDFLTSAALSELIRINEAATRVRGIVRLCGLSKDIQKVFKITKLDEMFALNPDDDVEVSVTKFKRLVERAAEEKAWEKKARH